MKKALYLLICFAFLESFATAQTAVVTRNVNLRPDASTRGTPLATLKTGLQMELLEPKSVNGFFHVRTQEGTEGWAWSRNLSTKPLGGSSHVGPARLYPDTTMTPGLADTLKLEDLTRAYTENCPDEKRTCTYSQAHRNVPASVHKKVYDEYNVPKPERNIKDGEVDHFYPLCAGGSNDIKNLWYQPAMNEWNGKDFGFHAKDKLEAYVCTQIKAGKLTPQDSYDRMTKDWVKFYLDENIDDLN